MHLSLMIWSKIPGVMATLVRTDLEWEDGLTSLLRISKALTSESVWASSVNEGNYLTLTKWTEGDALIKLTLV